MAKRETYAGYHNHPSLALATEQPIAALNGLLGGTVKAREQGIRLLLNLQNFRRIQSTGLRPMMWSRGVINNPKLDIRS